MLARKFGSLLEVPTHTVNMTTLRDTHDIWRSYSMSPYEVSGRRPSLNHVALILSLAGAVDLYPCRLPHRQ